jgi:hypothetical protein
MADTAEALADPVAVAVTGVAQLMASDPATGNILAIENFLHELLLIALGTTWREC